jgi:putative transposase
VYDSPGSSSERIAHFVEYYNDRRLHESLQNVTPADVYTKRQAAILDRHARITRRTLARRTRENLSAA